MTKDGGRIAMRAITRDQAGAVAELCVRTRAGLQEVIDLIVIHNERTVRGAKDRRTSLNRLIAFQTMVVWERFAREVKRLVIEDPVAAAKVEKENGVAYLGTRAPGPAGLPAVLSVATVDVLPSAYSVWLPTSGSGRSLTFGRAPVAGDVDGLSATVDWWIDIRNGVAHRKDPLVYEWVIMSDAKEGATVNTTTARFCFTLFLQLIDQTIRCLLARAELDGRSDLAIPQDWLRGREVELRRGEGDDDSVMRLWHGRSLVSDEHS